jgi:hypothetical protein
MALQGCLRVDDIVSGGTSLRSWLNRLGTSQQCRPLINRGGYEGVCYRDRLPFKGRGTVTRHVLSAFFVVVLLSSCSKPTDIVLGPEPLKQIAEQGDQFRKLSEEDRMLLVGYLTILELGKSFGADVKRATGRTVGEVLVDAREWKQKLLLAEAEAKKLSEAKEAEAKKRKAEEEALREKVLAERKAVAERIGGSVTVAVTDKRVLPKSYDARRYSDMLILNYALENKSDKTIRQLKGTVVFVDATGDKVGDLPVDFDIKLAPGKSIKTDTGRGWTLNEFRNGEIEKIAGREFGSMKVHFEPEAIAFEGGEVLRAPNLRR